MYLDFFWSVFFRIRTEYGPEKLWMQKLSTLRTFLKTKVSHLIVSQGAAMIDGFSIGSNRKGISYE